MEAEKTAVDQAAGVSSSLAALTVSLCTDSVMAGSFLAYWVGM